MKTKSKEIMCHGTFLYPEHLEKDSPCPCSDCRAGLVGGPVHDWVQKILAKAREDKKKKVEDV